MKNRGWNANNQSVIHRLLVAPKRRANGSHPIRSREVYKLSPPMPEQAEEDVAERDQEQRIFLVDEERTHDAVSYTHLTLPTKA